MIPAATTRAQPALRPHFPGLARNGRILDPWLAAAVIVLSTAATLALSWTGAAPGLAPDEAHYWEWSRRLDWSYYS
jgi:hypothetical protein